MTEAEGTTPYPWMNAVQIRPAVEVQERLSSTLGPHFASYFTAHFNGFGGALSDIGLCNRLALLLADYSESLPAVARAPWGMGLEAFSADLMPSIVVDEDAARAAAIWDLVTKEEAK